MTIQGIHHHHRLLSIALLGLALPFASASLVTPSSGPGRATSTATFLPKNTRLAKSTNTVMKFKKQQHQQQVPTRDSWDQKAWANGFSTVETEECYEIEGGDFPKDLQGTFFQNGFAKFNVGNEIMIHPFDGDGMVSAVTIKDGKAWYRNRYVQTPGYLKELQTGKIQYRNLFGTTRNHGKWWSNIFDLRTKNVANTHVLYVPGSSKNNKDKKTDKLYALWEGGRPFEMDPITLQTFQPGQESDLNGSLDKLYAAHYKIDPDSGRVVNFCIGLGESMIDLNHSHSVTVFEHDRDDNMKLLSKKKYYRPGFGMAHDVAISKNFMVMFQTHVTFNPLPWILGQKCLAQCMKRDKTATMSKLHLFPRDPIVSSPGDKSDTEQASTLSSPIIIEIPMAFTFHTVNAFESNDGKLLSVDAVMTDRMDMPETETESTEYPTEPVWDTLNYSEDLPPFSIRRYTIDLKSRSLLDIQTMTGSWSKTVDFPTMNPSYLSKPYRYAYVVAGVNPNHVTPLQGLSKVNVQQGQEIQKWIPPHEYQFLTELVFVPRGDEDKNNNDDDNDEDYGYLVGYLLNGRDLMSSQFVVFDAQDITKGPIAQAPLKTGLSHRVHGTFVKGFTPSIDEALSSYNK